MQDSERIIVALGGHALKMHKWKVTKGNQKKQFNSQVVPDSAAELLWFSLRKKFFLQVLFSSSIQIFNWFVCLATIDYRWVSWANFVESWTKLQSMISIFQLPCTLDKILQS